MRDKKYRIGSQIVLRDENRAVNPKACNSKTMGNNETEKIWTEKSLKV
jgi:hypothetical protein